jgi:hypothetical protein
MRLSEGDVVCGVAAATARAAVRAVEEAQWCSAGVLAQRLGLDIAACRSLLEALAADGYLDKPYRGLLPEGHGSEWLPDEEFGDRPLLLWHLSYPKGKSLAKARIGPPVPRIVAEGLVRDVLSRVIEVNRDLTATHLITRVTMFGSMTDPSRDLVSDVDLAVWADRRSDVPLGIGPELLPDGEARSIAEDLAARDRCGLEVFLAADDERIDVSVVDGWSETVSAVPSGGTEIELFPSLAPAAAWANAAASE